MLRKPPFVYTFTCDPFLSSSMSSPNFHKLSAASGISDGSRAWNQAHSVQILVLVSSEAACPWEQLTSLLRAPPYL